MVFELNLKSFSFRPAYIYPVESRKEPNVAYKIFRVLYPVFNAMGLSIRSTDLANAMFNVGVNGAKKQILENKDIFEYVSLAN